MTRARANYRAKEVKAWVEEYEELSAKKGTTPGGPLRALLSLLDIERAYKMLGPHEYQAVLLCGLLGVPMRDAAEALGVSAMTVSRRYRTGLEEITNYLNGVALE